MLGLWDGASATSLTSDATGEITFGSLMPSENAIFFNPPQTETSCIAGPLIFKSVFIGTRTSGS